MARNTENLSPVTGAVTPELREALEDYRWKNRKTLSEVIRSAIEYWAQGEGIWSPEGDETEPEKSEDSDEVKADGSDEDKAAQAEHDKADAADKTTPAKSRSTRAGK